MTETISWKKLKKQRPKPIYKELGTYGEYYEAGGVERYLDQVELLTDGLQNIVDKVPFLLGENLAIKKQCEVANEVMLMWKEKAEEIAKKLESIFGKEPIEYPCCFGEYYDTDHDEECNQAHICKFRPECITKYNEK